MEIIGRTVTTGRLGHHDAKAAIPALREFLRADDTGEMAKRMEALKVKIAALRCVDLKVVH